MVGHWQGEGKTAPQIKVAWNDYVPKQLLPRLTAFELKMAAYAIAHMKIGVKLVETGYTFGSDERAQILLTNTLQPARELDLEERMRLEAMAHEAERANTAKTKTPFTVVIGNPPYKGHSMNPSKIKGKLTFAGEIIQRFFQVRGEPLGEKNPKWLNNDYVKFIAFGMRQIEHSGAGVLGYITSNSWLDGPTFRGVRTEVIDCFPQLRIVDLHGNINKRENAPDGTRDEGVFSIEEGTNITIGGKLTKDAVILQRDLLGKIGEGSNDGGKLDWLDNHKLADAKKPLSPLPPIFRLTPMATTVDGENPLQAEFYQHQGLTDIQSVNSAGIVTANDDLCVQFTADEMAITAQEFLAVDLAPYLTERDDRGGATEWKLDVSANPLTIELRQKKEPRDWQAEFAQKDLKALERLSDHIVPIAYRPFDIRSTVFTGNSRGFQCMPRPDVMEHMVGVENVGISTVRGTEITGGWEHVFVFRDLIQHHSVSLKEVNSLFPLWLKPSVGEVHRRPNIDRAWAESVGQTLGLTYEDGIPRGQQGSLGRDFIQPKAEQTDMLHTPWDGCGNLAKSFGPRDLFDYIYALLHAPGYRSRYADFLKSAFPRIPTPKDRATFADLVPLGRNLVALHLLKHDDAAILKTPDIRFAGTGSARVEKGYPQYDNGKVMINATRWFEDVPRDTWVFAVGGYTPCEKWLKDRAAKGGKKQSDGRVLTDEDIMHYRRMVVALTETRRVMAEIDGVIAEHGGWPGAFSIASSTAPVQLPALVTLQDGIWTWLASIQPGDRLRYAAQYTLWQMDPATDASRLRFVIASLAEPRLLTPLLSDDDRAAWVRLVGAEAVPQEGVTRLRPAINAAWRAMFETMITSGQLAEQSDGSWSRGQHFNDTGLNAGSADAQRAAFALGAVRAISADHLQAAVAPEDNVVWANFG